jgi:hypothetical protein
MSTFESRHAETIYSGRPLYYCLLSRISSVQFLVTIKQFFDMNCCPNYSYFVFKHTLLNLKYQQIKIPSTHNTFLLIYLKHFKTYRVDVSNIERRFQNKTRSTLQGSIPLYIWTKWLRRLLFSTCCNYLEWRWRARGAISYPANNRI